MERPALSIYIHIPFCVRKCNYCDFLSFSREESIQREYVRHLLMDMRAFGHRYGKDYRVISVFLGGGTPSCLPSECVKDILETVHQYFDLTKDCEVTMECNPGTVDRNKLSLYHALGVNRISFGLQSTDDEELRMLGRIHTFKEFLSNYDLALRVGFVNLNIDLMSAIPKQKINSYRKTLRNVMMLKPKHISAYSLIIEEGTPFGEACSRGEDLILPSEEEEREMYHETESLLMKNGYQRYEISNYARPGYECRHNMVYWERGEYVGFGLGAASLLRCHDYPLTQGFKDTRLKNTSKLEDYCRIDWERVDKWNTPLNTSYYEEIEPLTLQACMEETMFLGLRQMKGVSAEAFRLTYGRSLEKVYGEVIDRYVRQGFLSYENGILRLSNAGIDVSNVILSDFLLEE